MELAVGTLALIGAYYLYRRWSWIEYKKETNILPLYMDDDKAKGLGETDDVSLYNRGSVPGNAKTNAYNLMQPAVQIMQRAMNGDVAAAAQFNQQYDGSTLFYTRRV